MSAHRLSACEAALQLAQRLALAGLAGVFHHRHGRVGRQALQQALLQLGGALHAHVDHQGQFAVVGGLGELRPVHRRQGPRAAGVACDHHHTVGMGAVGQGAAQVVGGGQPRRDAIDHPHFNAVRLQMRLFFAAAAKNQRIATFQAHHVFTRQSLLHHQLFDEGLRRGLAATALAHVDDAGRGGCVGQHVRVHQVIHQHDAGGLQGFHRFEGQ